MVRLNSVIPYDGLSFINNPKIPSPLLDKILSYPKESAINNGLGLRLDQLADMLYKDVDLWWVIALYNGIADPFNVPKTIIYYIPREDLLELIQSD